MKLKLIFNSVFFKVVFILYLLLKPFYFFDSGSLQIADYVLFPGMVLYFIIHRPFGLFKQKSIQYLAGFLLVVLLVNSSYALLVFDNYQWQFIKPIFFYVYNSLVFVFCFCLFKTYTKKDFGTILLVIFVSLFIQYTLILLDIDKGVINNFKGRDYNYFNNPNQLAYYSLTLLTFVFFIKHQLLKVTYWVSLCVSLSLVLIICTTSFSVLIGGCFFLIMYGISIDKKEYIKHVLLLLLPILLLISIKYTEVQDEYHRITARFENPQQRLDSSITDRGYDRIVNDPYYFFYGAGEGMYERFVPVATLRPQEIHNTFLSVFFSYGVLGGILFLLFLFRVFKNLPFSLLILILPVIVYNLFHNGIRFSITWVLIAYIYYVSRINK